MRSTASDSTTLSPMRLGFENVQSSFTIGKPTRRVSIIAA